MDEEDPGPYPLARVDPNELLGTDPLWPDMDAPALGNNGFIGDEP